MSNKVLVSHQGPITIIQFNRPQVRNAVDVESVRQLRQAWLAFEADDSAHVGILTGGNDVFCAGADLNEVGTMLVDADKGPGPLGIGRMTVSKPTIAAVAGHAVGGGFEYALWCDLCICDETAVFGFFQRRFGFPLLNGGSKRLSATVGLRRALDIVLTGRPIYAEEALAIGLVNEVTSAGQALHRALEIAEYLASVPQVALRNDRQAIYDNLDTELDLALIQEARLARNTLQTDNPLERVDEFWEN